MLVLELNHHQYSKTDHRYYLSPNLKNRSKGSIEFKHQNITAALMKMGLPYIKGYKARFKYQHLLDEEIASYLDENQRTLEKIFDNFSRELVAPEHFKQMDFQNIVSTEPIISKVDKAEPLF